jgi:hypothetical protein
MYPQYDNYHMTKLSYPRQTNSVSDAQHAGMATNLVPPTSHCSALVHGAAMCAYCSAIFDFNTEMTVGSSEARRMDILDALSSPDLGLTEREQMAVGTCLAYFDHFNGSDCNDRRLS